MAGKPVVRYVSKSELSRMRGAIVKMNEILYRIFGIRRNTKSIRNQKKIAFKHFFDESEDLFNDFASSTYGHDYFCNNYGFFVRKGGSKGGFDKRIVEIFYGSAPYEQIIEHVDPNNMFSNTRHRNLISSGSALYYKITDNGSVICVLYPAKTEDSHPVETAIILGMINQPNKLNGIKLPRKHWKYLYSYMHVTCIDGSPTYMDIIRIGWLRFTRKTVVNGATQRERLIDLLTTIITFALTVGLSGSLLFGIQYYFGLTVPTAPIENRRILPPSELPRSHLPEIILTYHPLPLPPLANHVLP